MKQLKEKKSVVRASRILVAVLMELIVGCTHLSPEQDASEEQHTKRVGLEEATAMVRARVFEDRPTMNESVEAPLVELTTDEMWRRLGVQLFKVTDGVLECTTYLIFDGRAQVLCGGMGGHGIQSACVTDLDGDEIPELTYTYSSGSGIHRSLIGVSRIDGDQLLNEEVSVAFIGDLFVRRESDSRVIVEIGRYEWEFSSWTPQAQLGVIKLEGEGDRLLPRIEFAPLPEEHSKAVWMLDPSESSDHK